MERTTWGRSTEEQIGNGRTEHVDRASIELDPKSIVLASSSYTLVNNIYMSQLCQTWEFLKQSSTIQMQLGAVTDTDFINALLDNTLDQTLKIWREILMLYFLPFFFRLSTGSWENLSNSYKVPQVVLERLQSTGARKERTWRPSDKWPKTTVPLCYFRATTSYLCVMHEKRKKKERNWKVEGKEISKTLLAHLV